MTRIEQRDLSPVASNPGKDGGGLSRDTTEGFSLLDAFSGARLVGVLPDPQTESEWCKAVEEEKTAIRNAVEGVDLSPEKRIIFDILVDNYTIWTDSSFIRESIWYYTDVVLEKQYNRLGNLFSQLRTVLSARDVSIFTKKEGQTSGYQIRRIVDGRAYEPKKPETDEQKKQLPFPSKVEDFESRDQSSKGRSRFEAMRNQDARVMHAVGQDLVRLIIPRLMVSALRERETIPLPKNYESLKILLSISSSDAKRVFRGVKGHTEMQVLTRAFIDALEEISSSLGEKIVGSDREDQLKKLYIDLLKKGVEKNEVVQAVCNHFGIKIPDEYNEVTSRKGLSLSEDSSLVLVGNPRIGNTNS